MGMWDVDVSGVMATAVAGGAAWLGPKQRESLFLGYSAAASDLALIRATRGRRGSDWPTAVAEAEATISKEHATWPASRPSTT
ncbi:hypothetical protein [Saccharothrix longispora]|uniref:hypothetical protein n=1 Tax=Saccharothrix longispora TaxID=33920 RepID=UPI00398CB038